MGRETCRRLERCNPWASERPTSPHRHRRRRPPSSRVEGASVTASARQYCLDCICRRFLLKCRCLFLACRQVVLASASVPFVQSGGCVGHRQHQRQCCLDCICMRFLLKYRPARAGRADKLSGRVICSRWQICCRGFRWRWTARPKCAPSSSMPALCDTAHSACVARAEQGLLDIYSTHKGLL